MPGFKQTAGAEFLVGDPAIKSDRETEVHIEWGVVDCAAPSVFAEIQSMEIGPGASRNSPTRDRRFSLAEFPGWQQYGVTGREPYQQGIHNLKPVHQLFRDQSFTDIGVHGSFLIYLREKMLLQISSRAPQLPDKSHAKRNLSQIDFDQLVRIALSRWLREVQRSHRKPIV